MENSLVVGAEIVEEDFQKKLDSVPRDKFLRINFDNLFMDKAIENIKKNPTGHIILFFKKAASFLLVDLRSPDPNYYNVAHYLPILLIGITSLLGIGFTFRKKSDLNYLILIFFAYVFIFSTVSVLPRYKLIILPMQIIFTTVFIERVKKRIYRHG